jgi:hypothetical protein
MNASNPSTETFSIGRSSRGDAPRAGLSAVRHPRDGASPGSWRVKFQIQPDPLVIFRIQEGQGDLNDPQTARNPA